jgi:hypothetical protein
MFYTNKEVAEQINSIYIRNNRGLNLPNKEDVIIKLNQRQAFSLMYMSAEEDPETATDFEVTHLPNNDFVVKQFVMVLKVLSFYPFGRRIWTDDVSMKLISESGLTIGDADMFNHIIEPKYAEYIKSLSIEDIKKKDMDFEQSFVNRLNMRKS